MYTRRGDRIALVEPDHSDPGSTSHSTIEFEVKGSSPTAAAPTKLTGGDGGSMSDEDEGAGLHQQLQQEHLGADDVQQAHQLQLQHPQQQLRKCEFCRKPVLPQREVPSCASRDGVVHTACAESERRYESRRLESERAASANRSVEEQHECIICQRAVFQRKEGAPPGVILREDQRWIKPCFCEVYAHHGCLAGVVVARRTCPQCGEPYEYREYGSLLDFLARYWLSYCFIGSIVGFFCMAAVYAMVHVVIYPAESWPSGRVVLLVLGLFLTAVAACCVGSCLRYTFGFRVPRFKSKYSFVRVSNYAPPLTREGGGGGGPLKRGSRKSGGAKEKKRKSTTLLMTQVPRHKGRSLLSFSLPSSNGDDSTLLHSVGGGREGASGGSYPYTSTPKIAGSAIPLDFSTPSFHSPKSFRKLEEHPLRLTLERVLELPEEDSISYDDTAKEMAV